MATAVQTKEVEAKCSRCESALDAECPPGTAKWCKACRAKYQREYNALRKEMSESRGFSAGCSAMRHSMAEYFKLFGNARFSGVELWQMISKAPGPEVRS